MQGVFVMGYDDAKSFTSDWVAGKMFRTKSIFPYTSKAAQHRSASLAKFPPLSFVIKNPQLSTSTAPPF